MSERAILATLACVLLLSLAAFVTHDLSSAFQPVAAALSGQP
jgi:Flp pilus assembly pilin Flp